MKSTLDKHNELTHTVGELERAGYISEASRKVLDCVMQAYQANEGRLTHVDVENIKRIFAAQKEIDLG